MTCIVALVHGGRVWMAGDSALTDDEFHQLSMAETKVFFKDGARKRGEFLIGGSGSARGGQLLRFRFKAPARPARMDADEYMATLWIDEVRKVFKAGGHTYIEVEGGEEATTAKFLVGYRGSVWYFDEDFQIERLRSAYAAIGSGSPIALGAMHATSGIRDMTPKKRVEAALRAACAYNAACRPPLTILTLGAAPDPAAPA